MKSGSSGRCATSGPPLISKLRQPRSGHGAGNPALGGVRVVERLEGRLEQVRTDVQGAFELRLPQGTQALTLFVFALGYAMRMLPVVVDPAQRLDVTVEPTGGRIRVRGARARALAEPEPMRRQDRTSLLQQRHPLDQGEQIQPRAQTTGGASAFRPALAASTGRCTAAMPHCIRRR